MTTTRTLTLLTHKTETIIAGIVLFHAEAEHKTEQNARGGGGKEERQNIRRVAKGGGIERDIGERRTRK